MRKVDLQNSGRSFLSGVLTGEAGFAGQLAPLVHRGACYCYLPDDKEIVDLPNFDDGGLMNSRVGNELLLSEVKARSESTEILLLQNVWAPASAHRQVICPNSFVVGTMEYFWHEAAKLEIGALEYMLKCAASFLRVLALINPPSAASWGRNIGHTEDELRRMAPFTSLIAVSAFDEESYVFWARD